MKEKYICLSSLFGLFASCQTSEKFNWNAGFSAPKNYLAEGGYEVNNISISIFNKA